MSTNSATSIEKPFFSVIIPVYNKERYLHSALQCLRLQTFQNFEVIVVNDNSQDDSGEILSKYSKEGRIRLFQRSESGPGGYAARNFGASHALADWLVFFDADDYLYPRHLECHWDNIKRNDLVPIFVNSYEIIDGIKRFNRTDTLYSGLLTRTQALELAARSDFFHMNSVCIARNFFCKTGGFPDKGFKRGGDVYYWIKVLALASRSYYSHNITSSWLIDRSGVTRDPNNLTMHPLTSLFRYEFFPSLTKRDRDFLKKSINRKVLLWADQKKLQKAKFQRDFLGLYYSQLNGRQWVRLTRMLLPLRKVGLRKKLRSVWARYK